MANVPHNMSYASPTPPNQAPRRTGQEKGRSTQHQHETVQPPGSQTERDANYGPRPLLSEPDFKKEEDSFAIE